MLLCMVVFVDLLNNTKSKFFDRVAVDYQLTDYGIQKVMLVKLGDSLSYLFVDGLTLFTHKATYPPSSSQTPFFHFS